MVRIFILSMVLMLLLGSPSWSKQNFSTEEPETTIIDSIPFSERLIAGLIEHKSINEASGITASLSFPGHLWTHNDSGDEAKLFLMDDNGKHISEISINNATNRDWEDIASGVDPYTHKPYVMIADIGDNDAKFKFVTLYQVFEPDEIPMRDTILSVSKKWTIKYPDEQRDAETLMIDPVTHDLFILSKRDPEIFIYRVSFPYPIIDTIIAEKTATLPFTQIVAGDISQDGKEILIKNYESVYYFKRNQNETITDALQKCQLHYPTFVNLREKRFVFRKMVNPILR
ncbi:MAG: hypothetical protein IPN49_03540 [Saprospiraceae bacterium]|nr:hypothetical protein [Saprospiraceae bacterium]